MEAMDYFRHHGVWIPKDISVIGFDDLTMSRLAYPRLTTIRQGAGEKGREAAKLLFQALEEKEAKKVAVSYTHLKNIFLRLERCIRYLTLFFTMIFLDMG